MSNILTEPFNFSPDFRRIQRLVTISAPVEILARTDDFEDRVVPPKAFVIQAGHRDIQQRENQVVAAKFVFAIKEGVEFIQTVTAADRSRRDNRDKESGLGNRQIDLVLPQFAVRDGGLVLPDPEIRSRAANLGAKLALNGVSQRRKPTRQTFIVFAGIAEESDDFRQVYE
ncbi:MAG: hypothetical protein ABSE50_02590 [Xanthobacteraceae bacterium]